MSDVFVAPAASEARRERAAAAGWPDGLIDRIAALRWPEWRQDLYLGLPNPEQIEREVTDRERLVSGLQVHEATWEDDERLSDLFANAAERIGDWNVTVERSPNPFAQMRLHENGHVKIVVDRGVAVAASMYSGRSSYVGGERLSVNWMGGWRVRDGMRRNGYANLLLATPGSGLGVPGMVQYWYVRVENTNAHSFIEHTVVERVAERPVDKLTATAHHYDPASAARPDRRVRAVEPGDLGRCVELVNRTHAGLDLFRPYGVDGLERRLDDLFWGPKPHFVHRVYGWPDMFVLEDGGEIVACAGLWDRGRDVRDRWRHRESGEERVVDSTYVLDAGYAEGRADAFAALLGHLAARTRDLGRSTMVAALEFLPDALAALHWATPQHEVRYLETMPYVGPDITVTARVTRPYTDLVHW